jgi:hypothetical protein
MLRLRCHNSDPLIQSLLDFLVAVDHDLLHGVVQQVARVPDIDCCLNFITSEHPDLDAGILQRLDCLADIVLELIFNPSSGNQLEPCLYFRLKPVHKFISSLNRGAGLQVALVPVSVKLSRDHASSHQ